jgi:hypothetical protein
MPEKLRYPSLTSEISRTLDDRSEADGKACHESPPGFSAARSSACVPEWSGTHMLNSSSRAFRSAASRLLVIGLPAPLPALASEI